MIILFAFTPLSMISILVMTPTVLIPFGSSLRAVLIPSEVVISALAGTTQRIIVLESAQYLSTIVLVIYSMFSAWPAIGMRVIPGKSIKVRSGQVCEYTFNTMGLSTIPLLLPQTLSVSPSIFSFTFCMSKNFYPGISSEKIAQGFTFSLRWFKRNSSGRLVQTPSPLGRKSRPTIVSRTEDFPADWPPTTAILGKLIPVLCTPTSLNSSYISKIALD